MNGNEPIKWDDEEVDMIIEAAALAEEYSDCDLPYKYLDSSDDSDSD